jgi:hypothetical protein
VTTTAPAGALDRFSQARGSRITAAAAEIGLAAGEIPTDEQLAHLAWHVGAVEPSELQHMDRLAPSASVRPTCLMTHRPAPDGLDEILPLPHPLDYEWRFDPVTRLALAQRCQQLAGSHGSIALLGTPTLAPALRGQAENVLLLDANARLLGVLASASQLGTIQWAAADLATFSPPPAWQHRADVVVCDPPWYPEGFATFLYAAAQLVHPGGCVLLSLPDALTRPSVADELDDLRSLARHLRLVISAAHPRTVRYRTPFFEYRALRAAGVRLVPLDWRAGTLWELTSTGIAPNMSSGWHRTPAVSDALTEVTISGVRLRVLRSRTRPVHPRALSLKAVVPGDALPTVSRRHPARGAANLWTSGNSALSCADPDLAGLFLRHLAGSTGNRLGDEHERLIRDFANGHHLPGPDVLHALDTINAVVALERSDHATYRAAAS